MALGGVATGSMKAKEALRVQGIITYSGFKLIDWDCDKKTIYVCNFHFKNIQINPVVIRLCSPGGSATRCSHADDISL